MKRVLKAFLIKLTLLLGISAAFWWRWASAPADPAATTPQPFVIPKGQSVDAIAVRLKRERLIKSQTAFKITVVAYHLVNKLQAGQFRLSPSLPLKQLAQALTQGTNDIWVTLLEGWRFEQIAAKLAEAFASKGWQFDRQKFIQAAAGQEGYLFPDTYLLPQLSEASVVRLLRDTFNKKVDFSRNQSGLSSAEAVILAAIVEREARASADRPLVAGILIKRLQDGWPLQTDATIQYLKASRNCQNQADQCDWWPQHLTAVDLQLVSPFNTYLNRGLPPAPIANPGLASLQAVFSPQVSPYRFYLSDRQGQLHYAQTLEEHNANIARYLGP